VSRTLAARIRQSLARRKNVKDKKMFGGIIFLLNGKWIQRARLCRSTAIPIIIEPEGQL